MFLSLPIQIRTPRQEITLESQLLREFICNSIINLNQNRQRCNDIKNSDQKIENMQMLEICKNITHL